MSLTETIAIAGIIPLIGVAADVSSALTAEEEERNDASDTPKIVKEVSNDNIVELATVGTDSG